MKSLEILTVNDAFGLEISPSIIVQKDKNLIHIIKEFAGLPELRGIFVVDEMDRLIGVITRRDLLDWARVQVGTRSGTSRVWLSEDKRLIKIIMASTAGEIIHPGSNRAAVQPHDSLAHALNLMIELDVICLPVVDAARQIIGDLKLMEILSLIVNDVQGEENTE